MKTIKLLSPAKINLYLDILGVRGDGYHLLRSVIQPVDLFDEISLDIAEGDGFELVIEGNKNVPQDNNNLMIKAATAYLVQAEIKTKIIMGLKKRIPLQAGLGGGSSNAAAVLYGLNKIFNNFDQSELLKIGSQIGSDVPFFINCRTALVEGTGDRIKTINSFPLLYYIVLKPPFGFSTKSIYDEWDKIHIKNNTTDIEFNIDKYINDFKRSKYLLFNTLEKPAILKNEKIKHAKNLLLDLGCSNVSMTGSGSAVFAVFENSVDAEYIFDYIKGSNDYEVFLCKGISGWHRL